jgi:hypothetical protein
MTLSGNAMKTTDTAHFPNRRLRRLMLAAATFSLGLAVATLPMDASALEWFSGSKIVGSGKLQTQHRDPGHFDAIALGMSGNVEVRLGDTDSVTVATDDNILPEIETVVENGTLRIRPLKKDARLAPTSLHFIVQAKQIEKLSLGGSGSITAAELRAPKLRFDIGGSGSIEVGRLKSDLVGVSLAGSGVFKAGGATAELNVSLAGSGRVQAGQLAANQAKVNIGGSGQAVIWAKQDLRVSVSGSGDVDYYGDPELSKSVSGSGKVRRLAAQP